MTDVTILRVDYRRLIKNMIRGMMYDNDVPSVPAAVDADGKPVDCDRDEMLLFFALVEEVMREEREARRSVLAEIANLKHDYLGG